MGTSPSVPQTGKVYLTINYGTKGKPRTLQEMIDAGRYHIVKEGTDTGFPITGEGMVKYEAKLFRFNRDIESDEADCLIRADDQENPWKPAKTEHLLCFGENYPDEQRKFSIIALGSGAKVSDECSVLVLGRDDSLRVLSLSSISSSWPPVCRFLAVRKVKI